jgi:hypothetical protein
MAIVPRITITGQGLPYCRCIEAGRLLYALIVLNTSLWVAAVNTESICCKISQSIFAMVKDLLKLVDSEGRDAQSIVNRSSQLSRCITFI